MGRRPALRPGPQAWIAGAISGVAWWAISVALGARTYGVLGTRDLTGVAAGMCTGIAVMMLSLPVYRCLSVRSLLWFSPLSVYVAIALYGAIAFLVRTLANDFHPDQIRWAVGLQSILGMWWGITVIGPIGIPVQLLAYVNHRLLWRLLVAGSGAAATGPRSPSQGDRPGQTEG